MALMLEYKPGADLTQPWAWVYAGRGLGGFQFGKDLTVKAAGANVLRDAHYIGGVRTTLLEPGSTNSLLQSQTLDNASWTKNFSTVSANVVNAPDGTATADKLVETAVTNIHDLEQNVTVTAQEFVALSGFFRAAERTKFRFRTNIDATNELSITVDLAAGTKVASGTGTAVLSGSVLIVLGGGWYWAAIWGKIGTGAGTTLNIAAVMQNVTESYAGDGTSGMYMWGLQLERWGTLIPSPPTSYMPTTTVPTSRSADTMSVAWPFQAQPMWLYMKFLDLGWSARAAFDVGPEWCDSVSNKPHLQVFSGSGAAGATPGHRLNWRTGTGPGGNNQVGAIVNPGAAWGDTVELFCRFNVGGNIVEINRSINGAAVSSASGAAAGGTAFADFSAPTLLFMNVSALIGLQALKIGADPTRVLTLVQAAAL